MDVLSAYRHGKNITSNINLFIIAAPVKALYMQDITSIDRERERERQVHNKYMNKLPIYFCDMGVCIGCLYLPKRWKPFNCIIVNGGRSLQIASIECIIQRHRMTKLSSWEPSIAISMHIYQVFLLTHFMKCRPVL